MHGATGCLQHNARMSALALPLFPAASLQGMSLQERWGVRLLSLLVWLLLAGSLAFWLLGTRGDAAMAGAMVADTALHAEEEAMARLLGHVDAPAEPVAAADNAPVQAAGTDRFVLQGAVANQFGTGIAVIAVEGQPARPFRVGQEVAEGWTLQAVGRRSATLRSKSGREVTLSFAAAGTGAKLAGGVPPHGASATPVQPVVPVAPAVQTTPSVPGGRMSRAQSTATADTGSGGGASVSIQATTPVDAGNDNASSTDESPSRRRNDD